MDASYLAIGAVLQIQTDEGFKTVAYNSRMLTNTEQIYLINNKELFAIIHALRKWRCYIEGIQNLIILIDHKFLELFTTQTNLN